MSAAIPLRYFSPRAAYRAALAAAQRATDLEDCHCEHASGLCRADFGADCDDLEPRCIVEDCPTCTAQNERSNPFAHPALTPPACIRDDGRGTPFKSNG